MDKSTHQAIVVPVVLEKIEVSDKLSVVRGDFGQVVVQTELWIGKDRGVFVPCENMVDTARPEFKSYAKSDRWRKINSCKICGTVSQAQLVQIFKNTVHFMES